MEEERDKSLQSNQNDGGIPDLEQEASQNDKKDEPEKKDSVSGGEESDRENRSVNESNSTGSEEKTAEKDGVKLEDEPVREGPGEAAPVLSVSNSKPVGEESHELGDSVTQLSSEVQSSASLGRKRKRKERKRGEEIGGDGIKGTTEKSEPLVGLIQMIRAHRHGSLFESRLEIQVVFFSFLTSNINNSLSLLFYFILYKFKDANHGMINHMIIANTLKYEY